MGDLNQTPLQTAIFIILFGQFSTPIDEVREGALVRVVTHCLGGGPRKLHMFHRLYAVEEAGERLLASGEHLLVHVDLGTRKATEMAGVVKERAEAMIAGHAGLPLPEGTGRSVGKK